MLKDLKPILDHKNTVKTIKVCVFGRQACDNLTIWQQQSWKNELFCHLKLSIFVYFFHIHWKRKQTADKWPLLTVSSDNILCLPWLECNWLHILINSIP